MGRKERQKQTRSDTPRGFAAADRSAKSQDFSGSRLFSIGHSNHNWPRFQELLRAAGVTAVADVRSQPYSRWLPQYNRNDLAQALGEHDITYAFLGNLLGGRPQQEDLYTSDGQVDYERVRQTAAFRRGLDLLIEALDQFKVAMLCSEEDPLDCHRGLMIAPALVEHGIFPAHLRGDGTVETTAALEDRLLAVTGCGNDLLGGLFAALVSAEDRQSFLTDAYRVQATRKAFRLSPDLEAGG
jgi:hypothetical protein